MNYVTWLEILSLVWERMRTQARLGVWDGRAMTPYFMNCQWLFQEFICTAFFTRDVGGHSGGWFRNPDYENCFHLSLSFHGGGQPCQIVEKFLTGLFGEHKTKLWIEPPYTPEGKQLEVWHYRLMCDDHWQPILPRKEVYSSDYTEPGWKSYSELTNQ